MRKYVVSFAGWYLVFAVAIAITLAMLRVNGGSTGFAALIAASMLAGNSFAKDHRRGPSPEEKSGFAWGALLVIAMFIIITVPAALFFALGERDVNTMLVAMASPMFWGVMVGVTAILGALHFWITRWAFGWYAERASR